MAISFQTCDLCDAHKHESQDVFRVLPLPWRSYGGQGAFAGPVTTIQCFEDNSLVKQALELPGAGGVLVVDGGGSMQKALVGGNLAAAAARNGWSGVLVFGCVRDVAELRQASVGIFAIGTVPMPTEKKGQGQRGVIVEIAGVKVSEGDWLYADADGVVISNQPIHI